MSPWRVFPNRNEGRPPGGRYSQPGCLVIPRRAQSKRFAFKVDEKVSVETQLRTLLVGKGQQLSMGDSPEVKSANAEVLAVAAFKKLGINKKVWSEMVAYSPLFVHRLGTAM